VLRIQELLDSKIGLILLVAETIEGVLAIIAGAVRITWQINSEGHVSQYRSQGRTPQNGRARSCWRSPLDRDPVLRAAVLPTLPLLRV